MEKVKLNNQIVSMRKFIKQAKVHAINKLVKQIKLLQNRRGSETQVQKAKRKADRFLEAVALLKKTKPDDVSKLALSKTKDWKEVLQQKNATLHDRCIAMLANYGAVQKEVEGFYKANKELVLKISDYIAQWEEKNRSSKDSPKTSKMSSEKKLIGNAQKEKFKNESLSICKKNTFKTVVREKSEFDESLQIPHEDKNMEAENSDSNDDNEIRKLQQTNNYANPIQNVKSSKSSKNTVETKESNNNNDDEEMIDVSFNINKNAKDLVVKNQIKEESDNDEESVKSDDEESDKSDAEELDKNDENNEETAEVSLKNNNNNEHTKDSSNEENNTNQVHESVSKLDLQLKIKNNAKNKLKAIAHLNLNELEGLEEIPVGSSFGNEESDENEASEDEEYGASHDINTDPFFLGHNKEDSMQNKNTDPFFLVNNNEDVNAKEFDDFTKESNVCISDPVYSSKNRTQNARSFLRRRKDEFSLDKNFQKSSKKYKNEKKSDKSFKRENFTSANYNNKFQERNRKDFKLNKQLYPTKDTYNRKQFNNASRSYGNKDDNISLKNKESFKKSNANEPLHPSWQAKRKQKELLKTSFQGKRMVFND